MRSAPFDSPEQATEQFQSKRSVEYGMRLIAFGETGHGSALNSSLESRHHYRLRTFRGWRDTQYPDGSVVWTSPSGKLYRTTSGGADLFKQLCPGSVHTARPGAAAEAEPGSVRRAGPGQEPAAASVNEAYRYTQSARRNELDRRRNRNRMRVTLGLFKGDEPSISPYCTWINDPFEPEELPPDWEPPPPLPPDPDDPPF